jgi:hypothetical protein
MQAGFWSVRGSGACLANLAPGLGRGDVAEGARRVKPRTKGQGTRRGESQATSPIITNDEKTFINLRVRVHDRKSSALTRKTMQLVGRFLHIAVGKRVELPTTEV